jgi:hypothetical protein
MSHMKIVNIRQGHIHKCENLKRKLYNCNANIYFNQQCLKQQLIPNYAKIKVLNTFPASKYTRRKITNTRIKVKVMLDYILDILYLHNYVIETQRRCLT